MTKNVAISRDRVKRPERERKTSLAELPARLVFSTISLECPGSESLNSTRVAHCEQCRSVCDRKFRAMSVRPFAVPRGRRGLTCQLAILQKGYVEVSWLNPPVREFRRSTCVSRNAMLQNACIRRTLQLVLEHLRRFRPHLIVLAPDIWNTTRSRQCQAPIRSAARVCRVFPAIEHDDENVEPVRIIRFAIDIKPVSDGVDMARAVGLTKVLGRLTRAAGKVIVIGDMACPLRPETSV